MTLDVTPARPAQLAAKINRKTVIFLAVLVALMLAWIGYFSRYGQCDVESQYCVVDVAGTGSEIGFEWTTPALYISTYDPGTDIEHITYTT